MLYKAHIRAYKGAWLGRSTILGALSRLKEELVELEDELRQPEIDYTKVLHEIADVCNFGAVLEDLVYHKAPLGAANQGKP
jgi:NTP pyrophosphatase (non-canonical NTP hydrolase)